MLLDPVALSESEHGSEASPSLLPWFAMQARLRYENLVAAYLRAKNYECFLPTYWCRRRWSDRVKDLEVPLFPGYLFCRFNAQDRLPILKTPGLISILGIGHSPVPVDETEINAVRTLVSSGLLHHPWPYASIGQRVRIEYGALTGLEGILQSFKGRHRIVVSVTLLQRSVAAEIDIAWVAPIRETLPFPMQVQSPHHQPRTTSIR